MKKLAMFGLVAASAVILGLVSAPRSADAGDACVRSDFQTQLVADACKKGGQKEAKKVMKKFLSAAKKQDSKVNCKSCHDTLKPDYKLKADAFDMFKKFGGK